MTIRNQFAPAISTLQEDNESVRVTRWYFPPRSETGWHKHVYDYVVVPTISGTLTVVGSDHSLHPHEIEAGESYFRKCGVEHNVVNQSSAPIEFVEVEFKGFRPAKS